ncbi:MAG: glycosyltransferase family 2 protein [Lachnospiraceae bacterium]|nr:glycosyltransferase family 2 protein [Lachnospiraceae bacterium]
MKTVDVIIPTYRPDKRFLELINRLDRQSYKVQRIIIVNTEEKYYNQLIYGTNFTEKHQNVSVYHVSKKEFDHGKSRNRGVRHSHGDYFICMTQDALPANEKLVEELVHALEQPRVAVAYGRQLPEKDCDMAEAYARGFNYPGNSTTKGQEDLPKLGIKTYFCSNVCAIYKRDIFDSLGGFINHTIFNEDMIYAAKAVKAGYLIAYAASAQVYHSHNYGCMEQFRRNFDLGVSQADHPEVFAELPSESEGIRMVKSTIQYLKEQKQSSGIPKVIVKSGFKYMGYRMGKSYQKLPHGLIDKCTMNPEYWKQHGLKKAATVIDATKGYGRSEAELAESSKRMETKESVSIKGKNTF